MKKLLLPAVCAAITGMVLKPAYSASDNLAAPGIDDWQRNQAQVVKIVAVAESGEQVAILFKHRLAPR